MPPVRSLAPVVRRALPAVLLAGSLLVLPAPARAEQNLRLEIAEVAKDFQKQLKGFNESSVNTGPVTGPKESNAGPGICALLREELVRAGVKVQPDARFAIRGEYQPADLDRGGAKELIVQVTFWMEDRGGKRVGEQLVRGVWGDETVASVMGLTVALPPGGGQPVRTQQLVAQLDNGPTVHIAGNRVAATPTSPYGVEILVKKGNSYEARQPTQEHGMAYVPLKRDDVYAIRLINDSKDDAAVTLTIDGLNLFVFSDLRDAKTGRPAYTTLVVPAKSSQEIRGWPKDAQQSNEFLVTSYDKSAAAELKSDAPVGVITACFAACWPKNGTPPADEPDAPPRAARSGDATGKGASFDAKYVPVERQFGVIRAAVSVRYSK
jgi:hypothetical protein